MAGGEPSLGAEPEQAGARLLVGVVGAPHGVRGEARIRSFTSTATAIGQHPLRTAKHGGRALRLTGVRALKDDGMVVARIEGVTTREAAAALTGTELFVERAALGPTAEGEFYHADLVGLRARTTAGRPVGRVAAVVDFGAGDLLEIAPPGGGATLLVPFLERFVPVVDLAGGEVVIEPAALPDEEPAAEPRP